MRKPGFAGMSFPPRITEPAAIWILDHGLHGGHE